MMRGRSFRMRVVATTVLAVFFITSPASAYNGRTHQQIVNFAWQVLRASADPGFVSHIQWQSGTPPPGASDADLRKPGPCANGTGLCGQVVTQAEWDEFLEDARGSMERLGFLYQGISGPGGCINTFFGTEKLDEFTQVVDANHVAQKLCDDCPEVDCSKFENYPWKPDGIFDDVGGHDSSGKPIGIIEDGAAQGNQGMTLGWHAQQRDDDWTETKIEIVPWCVLFPGLVCDGPVQQIDEYVDAILFGIFVPFVCAYLLLSGSDENCLDAAKALSQYLDPVDLLHGLIPGIGLKRNGDYTGVWHHMHMQRNGTWDDIPGLQYTEAGPKGESGALDRAIVIASDFLYLRVDADDSAGTDRYQQNDANDGHPDPTGLERGDLHWQGPTLGHVEFNPLDNLALYGWRQYKKDVASGYPWATGLGWPLHAIGDATVPHHIVGTSSMGHLPYENWVESNLPKLLFQACIHGNIDEVCTLQPTDAQRLAQLQQAHRILELAFGWRKLGQPTHVRDFISGVATSTLMQIGGPNVNEYAWPWCDGCSLALQLRDVTTSETLKKTLQIFGGVTGFVEGDAWIDDPVGHYAQYESAIRPLVENAIGATTGFLMAASQGLCKSDGLDCSYVTGDCCGGGCAGAWFPKCCRTDGRSCTASTQCCSGYCIDGVCCSGGLDAYCTTNARCCDSTCVWDKCCPAVGTACTSQSQCCSYMGCNGGKCCGKVGTPFTCTADDQCCLGGVCTNGSCCSSTETACSADGECCSGLCGGGKCCLDAGSACTTDSQCCLGDCDNNNKCCVPKGGYCGDGQPCCLGSFCQDGYCKQVA